MDKNQLLELIKRVLVVLKLDTQEAVDLLMLTAAQESCLGRYIRQKGGGPALGIFQMEPATLNDLYDNYLKYHDDKLKVLQSFRTMCSLEMDLTGNLLYQIAAARLQYFRKPEKLPSKANYADAYGYVFELAKYWKKHWNTSAGKGTVKQAVQNYYQYVLNG